MRSIVLMLLFSLQCIIVAGQRQDSIVLKDAVLYYYTYGQGKPILLLSGGPGISAHQEDDVAKELAKDYQTILFDQRGTGKSWTKPFDTTTINLDQAVADLELLRTHLKISKWNMTGHSWGAMLAAAYLSRHPDKVNAVAMIGGGELDMVLSPIVTSNIGLRMQLADTAIYDYWDSPEMKRKDSAKASYEIRKVLSYGLIYDRSKVDIVMAQIARGDKSAKMSNLMWGNLRRRKYDVTESCRNYKGAALIIYGWQDPIGLTTLSQYMKAFPTGQFVGIDKSGHFPSIEQPEKFYTALKTFFVANIK